MSIINLATAQRLSGAHRARRFSEVKGPLSLVAWLVFALSVRRERNALLALDDHMLKDLGLSRSGAFREGTRAFTDLPGQDPADRRRSH